MNLSTFTLTQSEEVIDLFTNVFSDSEGAEEGKLIGELASDLIKMTPKEGLYGFVALDNDEKIMGCVFFSRMLFKKSGFETDIDAFILAPMAVSTEQQGKGVGQKLIKFGIDYLKQLGVELIITYGDPDFYSKVGFKQISEDVIKAPLKLSLPHGWLAQSLVADEIPTIVGESRCVEALNKQVYW